MTSVPDSALFDLAPIPLWVEDFSDVKKLFEQWRSQGVRDIRTFLREDAGRVAECSQRIKILGREQEDA